MISARPGILTKVTFLKHFALEVKVSIYLVLPCYVDTTPNTLYYALNKLLLRYHNVIVILKHYIAR